VATVKLVYVRFGWKRVHQFRVVSPIVKWKISTGAMAMSVLKKTDTQACYQRHISDFFEKAQ